MRARGPRVRVRGALATNDLRLLTAAAVAGRGIALLPEPFMAAERAFVDAVIAWAQDGVAPRLR